MVTHNYKWQDFTESTARTVKESNYKDINWEVYDNDFDKKYRI